MGSLWLEAERKRFGGVVDRIRQVLLFTRQENMEITRAEMHAIVHDGGWIAFKYGQDYPKYFEDGVKFRNYQKLVGELILLEPQSEAFNVKLAELERYHLRWNPDKKAKPNVEEE